MNELGCRVGARHVAERVTREEIDSNMRRSRITMVLTGTVLALLVTGFVPADTSAQASSPPGPSARPPNFLVIVADDLGWSDLGSFGGEIATPHLDALALSGIRFTGFHTAPACSPSRAMLLTGVDSHQAGLGTMAELADDTTRGIPGYETYLNDRVATVADVLHAGGYLTLMSGKWHLGMTSDREPSARGFEQSFALLEGAANHFGADQGRAWQEAGFAPSYRENGEPARLPEGAYSSDYFVDRLIGFLDDAGKHGDTRPFFAYLSFTAPHRPRQAPDEVIAKYRGRYDGGYEALRRSRLTRQKRLGLLAADAVPHPMDLVRPWPSLGPEERALEARKMEVYAAMVDRMDQNVGRLVSELKRLGLHENTLILFLADNGPDGRPLLTPDHKTNRPPDRKLGVDNRLANIGRATSYISYGPGWAQANSAPSRLMKGFMTEGGIRVAAFAAGRGVAGNGRIVNATVDVRDVAPTLLDLAGLSQPDRFGDRPILSTQGASLRRLFDGRASTVRSADEPLGYELFFHRALRKGDWKAVFIPKSTRRPATVLQGEGRWQLFNLVRDPGETRDLAAEEPEKLQELVRDYDAYAVAKGVMPPPPQVYAP